MARKGLGKGLDSLIPKFYDEDFDSNSPQSLEDILNQNEDNEVEEKAEDISQSDEVDEKVEEVSQQEEVQVENDESIVENTEESESIDEDVENDSEDIDSSNEDGEIKEEISNGEKEEEIQKEISASEDLSGNRDSEEIVQTPQEIQRQKEHVEEVKAIVDKNPRITLWSSRSSAVFRYLRKTEPEFSISKEASVLIEEAVAKKYPEIWALFEDL